MREEFQSELQKDSYKQNSKLTMMSQEQEYDTARTMFKSNNTARTGRSNLMPPIQEDEQNSARGSMGGAGENQFLQVRASVVEEQKDQRVMSTQGS